MCRFKRPRRHFLFCLRLFFSVHNNDATDSRHPLYSTLQQGYRQQQRCQGDTHNALCLLYYGGLDYPKHITTTYIWKGAHLNISINMFDFSVDILDLYCSHMRLNLLISSRCAGASAPILEGCYKFYTPLGVAVLAEFEA